MLLVLISAMMETSRANDVIVCGGFVTAGKDTPIDFSLVSVCYIICQRCLKRYFSHCCLSSSSELMPLRSINRARNVGRNHCWCFYLGSETFIASNWSKSIIRYGLFFFFFNRHDPPENCYNSRYWCSKFQLSNLKGMTLIIILMMRIFFPLFKKWD